MRILVAGRLACSPGQGGATWAVLQYVLGLAELGHDVLVVDPGPPAQGGDDYFDRIVESAGLVGRAALLAGPGHARGMAYGSVALWAAQADLLINLAGCLSDDRVLGGPRQRMYVDLDPAFTQLWHTTCGVDMGLSSHDVFVTVGQRIGHPDCGVPTCDVTWEHTLPPVVLSHWPVASAAPTLGVTTVANWRSYGSIEHNGVQYGQKVHSMRELMHLPSLVPELTLEPAIAIDTAESADIEAMHRSGWQYLEANRAHDPGDFQRFVQDSAVEIGVAKSGYTLSRCGWFSDRSAAYLASGRPVVAQDTGWTVAITADSGLLPFTNAEGAASALRQVVSDYGRHARAARQLACELFDSHRVLTRLLSLAGV